MSNGYQRWRHVGESIEFGQQRGTLISLAGKLAAKLPPDLWPSIPSMLYGVASTWEQRLEDPWTLEHMQDLAGYACAKEEEKVRTATAALGETTAHWIRRPLSALKKEQEITQGIWGGYIKPGSSTLFVGLWKGGKTTLTGHLLANLDGQHDTFCGETVTPGSVLVISEESESLWAFRRDAFGIRDHIHIVTRPFPKRATKSEWEQFVEWVASQAGEMNATLVVFDALPNLWSVTSENDAGEVLAALAPMNTLTSRGIAVLLITHPSKADTGQGRSSRGSGAIGGFVDVIVELRRYAPENLSDTRRTLLAYSRFDDTKPELVIQLDLTTGAYTTVATTVEARAQDRLLVVVSVLKIHEAVSGKSELTDDEILAEWPEGRIAKPGISTLKNELQVWATKQFIQRTGKGAKGDPFRYSSISEADSTSSSEPDSEPPS